MGQDAARAEPFAPAGRRAAGQPRRESFGRSSPRPTIGETAVGGGQLLRAPPYLPEVGPAGAPPIGDAGGRMAASRLRADGSVVAG